LRLERSNLLKTGAAGDVPGGELGHFLADFAVAKRAQDGDDFRFFAESLNRLHCILVAGVWLGLAVFQADAGQLHLDNFARRHAEETRSATLATAPIHPAVLA